jgi:hypothetical protein
MFSNPQTIQQQASNPQITLQQQPSTCKLTQTVNPHITVTDHDLNCLQQPTTYVSRTTGGNR